MKKYLMLVLSLVAFCFSTMDGNEPSHLGPEIELTLMNTTTTDVRINLKEETTQNPYTYVTVLQIKLAPGEVAAMPVSLADTNEPIRKLFITAKGDKKYEKGGSLTGIDVDVANSNNFEIRLWEGTMPRMSNWHYIRIGAELL